MALGSMFGISIPSLSSNIHDFAMNKYSADRAHGESEWAARDSQSFVERMSNTAHQRESADLAAAGLNRVLSISHPGASTPSVATQPGRVPDFAAGGVRMAGDALGVANGIAALKHTDAGIRNLDSSSAANRANALKTLAEVDNISEAKGVMSSMAALNAELRKLRAAEAGSFKGKSWYHSLTGVLDQVRSFIPFTHSPSSSGGSGSGSVSYDSNSGGFR